MGWINRPHTCKGNISIIGFGFKKKKGCIKFTYLVMNVSCLMLDGISNSVGRTGRGVVHRHGGHDHT